MKKVCGVEFFHACFEDCISGDGDRADWPEHSTLRHGALDIGSIVQDPEQRLSILRVSRDINPDICAIVRGISLASSLFCASCISNRVSTSSAEVWGSALPFLRPTKVPKNVPSVSFRTPHSSPDAAWPCYPEEHDPNDTRTPSNSPERCRLPYPPSTG